MGHSLHRIRVIIGHQTHSIHVIYQFTKIIIIHETRSISEIHKRTLLMDYFFKIRQPDHRFTHEDYYADSIVFTNTLNEAY